MQYDATGKLLKSARRILWLHGFIDRVWLCLMLVSGILGLSAVLHTFFMTTPMTWWGSAALLPVAAATMLAFFNRPSLEMSARAVDRWLNTHDLLTAAWYLRSQSTGPLSDTALVVLDQADQVAINAARKFPRVRRTRRPLPTVVAIAVLATSLFFLSLQGAGSPGKTPASPLDNSRAGDHTTEDNWLPVLKPNLPARTAVAGDARVVQEPGRSSFVSSGKPLQQVPATTQEHDQGEQGLSESAKTLQSSKATGAGRLASNEAPPPTPDGNSADSTASLGALELVTLDRKPIGEVLAVDRIMSVGLNPFDGSGEKAAALAQDVTAARAAKEPFSPAIGPAYRALQARYFEEISHHD